jgi:hypothetical protein
VSDRPPNMHTATIKDVDGNPHEYLITLHPPTEGEILMWQLAELAGESLGGILSAALSGGSLDLDAGIDFSAAGRDVANALRRTNMPAFRAALLKHTIRDGKRLDDPMNFNEAYQANYAEIFLAMKEVLQVNRLFPRPDTPKS